MVQWLRLRAPTAGAWVPSLGRDLLIDPHTATESLHATAETWCSQINSFLFFFLKKAKAGDVVAFEGKWREGLVND